ncbi:MAG: HAD-IA family hydrolase [Pseudomonadales bacterium]|nr:HAD-IA family hydrolase [Pseudomonadales bacterium]
MRHLVFDLGNVLLAWDPLTVTLPPALAGQWDEASQSAARETLFLGPGWQAFDAGVLSAESLAAQCSEDTGHPQALFSALIEAMPASLVPVTPMLAFLSQVAAHHPCHLLSNIARDTWRAVCQRYAFPRYFQSMTLSYVVGVNKPAECIYAHSFAAGAFAPEDAVFIDDRQENLAASEALGMAGLHLPTPTQADAAIAKLERWLAGGPLEQVS